MPNTKVNQYTISWQEWEKDVKRLVALIRASEIRMRARYESVYGIPRGGLVLAVRLSHILGIPITMKPGLTTLVVDDVSDSGATLAPIRQATATLYRKDRTRIEPTYCVRTINKWINFPWEGGVK